MWWLFSLLSFFIYLISTFRVILLETSAFFSDERISSIMGLWRLLSGQTCRDWYDRWRHGLKQQNVDIICVLDFDYHLNRTWFTLLASLVAWWLYPLVTNGSRPLLCTLWYVCILGTRLLKRTSDWWQFLMSWLQSQVLDIAAGKPMMTDEAAQTCIFVGTWDVSFASYVGGID